MSAIQLALLCVAGLISTAILAVAVARQPWASRCVYACCLSASSIIAVTGLVHLTTGAVEDSVLTLPLGLPWLGSHFRIDALSSFFLIIVNLGAAGASLYALGYGQHETDPGRVLPFFAAFLAGMNLVVLADDAFTFLASWEFMSLASWALVIAHYRQRENIRAGFVYLLMASFGTLALLLTFGLLAGASGHYAFITIRAGEHSSAIAAFVFALALIGAGSKAGLFPLHVWLPLAHPAAPSHVSALMSGVMTKVAIYGFIRIVFDLLGGPPWWSSIVLLVVGGATAVLGVLQAYMERDLKRLLAYSTIENVGIVFLGIGLAIAFQANGMVAAAALALTAALFHAFNHSLFKSLLFFGAGAVLTQTHTRNLEKLGGLIHRMPATAFLFLVGAMAISALPPLNGFVSEWLTFQAVLLSPGLSQWSLKILIPGVGALLALSAALAAGCFVRAYGVAFLGRPRSAASAHANDADHFSLAAMALLALLCLLSGILPGPVIDILAPVVRNLIGTNMPPQSLLPWNSLIPIAESRSSYNGLLVFLFITISTLIAIRIIHRFASRGIRRAPAWDCGFPVASPVTQYSASSFAQPIRRVFGTVLFSAREKVDMPRPGETRPARFSANLQDLVWTFVYAPIPSLVSLVAGRLNLFQFLTIRKYLSLVFAALVVLLFGLSLWS